MCSVSSRALPLLGTPAWRSLCNKTLRFQTQRAVWSKGFRGGERRGAWLPAKGGNLETKGGSRPGQEQGPRRAGDPEAGISQEEHIQSTIMLCPSCLKNHCGYSSQGNFLRMVPLGTARRLALPAVAASCHPHERVDSGAPLPKPWTSSHSLRRSPTVLADLTLTKPCLLKKGGIAGKCVHI